jgi:hypothetical protein
MHWQRRYQSAASLVSSSGDGVDPGRTGDEADVMRREAPSPRYDLGMTESAPSHSAANRPNPVIARFAEGLLDQHRLVEKVLRREAPDLEWQPAPGRNSIGMLLAHNAIVEVWWLDVSARGIVRSPESDARILARLGIGPDDDGMPAKEGGGHPSALAGWTLERYLDLLAKARACTEECLATWRDADLDEVIHLGKRDVTRGWIVYHLLEHFAQHAGQISLMAALQRTHGARPDPSG